MLSLNLPSYEIKIAERNGKNVIFDMLRKRYVALTPEEWVRQHFVHYLTDYKGYPKGLLANEIQLDLNGTKKRCDTVLYNKDLSAKLIVEYKAPHISVWHLDLCCRAQYHNVFLFRLSLVVFRWPVIPSDILYNPSGNEQNVVLPILPE